MDLDGLDCAGAAATLRLRLHGAKPSLRVRPGRAEPSFGPFLCMGHAGTPRGGPSHFDISNCMPKLRQGQTEGRTSMPRVANRPRGAGHRYRWTKSALGPAYRIIGLTVLLS